MCEIWVETESAQQLRPMSLVQLLVGWARSASLGARVWTTEPMWKWGTAGCGSVYHHPTAVQVETGTFLGFTSWQPCANYKLCPLWETQSQKTRWMTTGKFHSDSRCVGGDQNFQQGWLPLQWEKPPCGWSPWLGFLVFMECFSEIVPFFTSKILVNRVNYNLPICLLGRQPFKGHNPKLLGSSLDSINDVI